MRTRISQRLKIRKTEAETNSNLCAHIHVLGRSESCNIHRRGCLGECDGERKDSDFVHLFIV